MQWGGWYPPPFRPREWLSVAAVFVGSGVLGALAVGLRGSRRLDARRAVVAAVIGATACIMAIFFIRSINFSRVVTGITWLVAGSLAAAWRLAAMRARPEPEGGWLVLGCGQRAEHLFRTLTPNRRDYRIIGVVRGRGDPFGCTDVAGYPVIGEMDDLPLLLRSLKPNELIVAWEHYQYSDLLPLVRRGGRYPRRIRLVPEGLPAVGQIAPDEWPLIDLDLHKPTWL
jgi:FlaA1/EpsC-like NDP-sugar epimerase